MRFPLARSLQSLVVFVAMSQASGVEPTRGENDPFPNLERLDTKLGFSFYYDPALSDVLVARQAASTAMQESGVAIERPLRTRLNGDHQWFTVDCDNGASEDLSCTFFRETPQGLSKVANLAGERFVFPGNGSVLTEGQNNQSFNVRRKFVLSDGQLVEARQPFYYVGLDSVALVDLDLYSSKDFRQPVARLRKGEKVTVLLNEAVDKGDGEYGTDTYLVKTPFGLVGWIRSPAGQPPVIEGLVYHGD
jgi:hypothetical protein